MSDYDLYPGPLDPTALPYQRHSASPYGYGIDLASWSNHLSKLSLHHDVTESLGLDASAYAYWGYPGRKDFTQYRAGDIGAAEPLARDETLDPTIFLNLGLEWRPCATTSLRIDGHKLLGWLDPQFGKRQSLPTVGSPDSTACIPPPSRRPCGVNSGSAGNTGVNVLVGLLPFPEVKTGPLHGLSRITARLTRADLARRRKSGYSTRSLVIGSCARHNGCRKREGACFSPVTSRR